MDFDIGRYSRSCPDSLQSLSDLHVGSRTKTPPHYLVRSVDDGNVNRQSHTFISTNLSSAQQNFTNEASPTTTRNDFFKREDPVANILSELELEDDKNMPFVLVAPSEKWKVKDDVDGEDTDLIISQGFEGESSHLQLGSAMDPKKSTKQSVEEHSRYRPLSRPLCNRFNLQPRRERRHTDP